MHDKVLLSIRNLTVAFPLKVQQPTSLRDAFISKLKNPFESQGAKDELFVALNNVSLDFKQGDRVGLIGVNGAGKSTLCRCISGYYKPKMGTIKRSGKIMALFESSLAAYPELSGRENLEVMAQVFFSEASDIKEIIEESIVFSELGSFIDAPIKTYSKGMLLRLSMSLMSARPTDILILDEVFDGADEFFREKLKLRIKKLIDNSRIVIFISHEEDQINGICNRAVLLDRGNVLYDGSIDEAYKIYRREV